MTHLGRITFAKHSDVNFQVALAGENKGVFTFDHQQEQL